MKSIAAVLAAVTVLAVAGPAPAIAAPEVVAAPASKPAYYKIEEEKFLGMGIGKYTYGGQPLALSEKPWWYGWTPDTTFNSGLTSDRFKTILAAHPAALANAQGRDGIRLIGMTANIGSRAVALGTALGLVGLGGIKNAQLALLSVIGLVGTGIVVDFGTEIVTFGSLERSISMYNEGPGRGASLNEWTASQPARADFEVGLFHAAF